MMQVQCLKVDYFLSRDFAFILEKFQSVGQLLTWLWIANVSYSSLQIMNKKKYMSA